MVVLLIRMLRAVSANAKILLLKLITTREKNTSLWEQLCLLMQRY